jgi:hypothetical protein
MRRREMVLYSDIQENITDSVFLNYQDAEKLELLAEWFDHENLERGTWSKDNEVQRDLRRVAKGIKWLLNRKE